MDIVDDSNPQGSFTFTGRYTGNSVADLLLGYPSATTNLIGPPVNDENSWQLAAYGEDSWRASSNLTLTYGLRYEYQTPDTSSGNVLGAFVPSLGKAVVVGTNGVPEGVRYQVLQELRAAGRHRVGSGGKSRHTLRGNYGIYYESLIHNIFQPSGFTSAPIAQQGQFNASATTPNISLSDPFPTVARQRHTGELGRRSASTTAAARSGGTCRHPAGDGAHGVIDVSYVGSYTSGQASAYNLNQPPPGAGTAQLRRPYPNYTTITWTDPGPAFAGRLGGHVHRAQRRRGFAIRQKAHLVVFADLDEVDEPRSGDSWSGTAERSRKRRLAATTRPSPSTTAAMTRASPKRSPAKP